MRSSVEWFGGQEVVTEDMGHAQDARRDAERGLVTDFWRSGIIKDPNGLSNFEVTVDSVTNTLINIGWGVGYANGFRLSIEADQRYYANNPFETTNGVCTQQSTGNRAVPLASYTSGQSNFVWLQYLEAVRSNPTEVSVADGSRHYPHRDAGYKVVVNTTNPPGNTTGITNSLYLATVFAQGASVALQGSPNGITDVSRSYMTLLPKDSVGTDALIDQSVTPQKLAFAGQYSLQSACFTFLQAASNTTIPLQPLLPTSAASKRFAQYAGFGIATTKTVFRPVYDGFLNIVSVSIEGDNIGFIVPIYDGLCNITSVMETIDGRCVFHNITYSSVDGTSLVSALQELGI